MKLSYERHTQVTRDVAGLLHRLTAGNYAVDTLLRDLERITASVRTESRSEGATVCAVCSAPTRDGLVLDEGGECCGSCYAIYPWLKVKSFRRVMK